MAVFVPTYAAVADPSYEADIMAPGDPASSTPIASGVLWEGTTSGLSASASVPFPILDFVSPAILVSFGAYVVGFGLATGPVELSLSGVEGPFAWTPSPSTDEYRVTVTNSGRTLVLTPLVDVPTSVPYIFGSMVRVPSLTILASAPVLQSGKVRYLPAFPPGPARPTAPIMLSVTQVCSGLVRVRWAPPAMPPVLDATTWTVVPVVGIPDAGSATVPAGVYEVDIHVRKCKACVQFVVWGKTSSNKATPPSDPSPLLVTQ